MPRRVRIGTKSVPQHAKSVQEHSKLVLQHPKSALEHPKSAPQHTKAGPAAPRLNCQKVCCLPIAQSVAPPRRVKLSPISNLVMMFLGIAWPNNQRCPKTILCGLKYINGMLGRLQRRTIAALFVFNIRCSLVILEICHTHTLPPLLKYSNSQPSKNECKI